MNPLWGSLPVSGLDLVLANSYRTLVQRKRTATNVEVAYCNLANISRTRKKIKNIHAANIHFPTRSLY
jgi:hypothetical protein